MPRAFIGIGSNIAPEENIFKALRRLAARERLTALSTFYRSKPLDRPEQPPFINGVAALDTHTSPMDLKQTVLRPIEAGIGRVRTADKYAPRPVDLDVLLYGDCVMSEPGLVLPDPEIVSRPFLAVPLAELAPDLPLPGEGKTIREIAAAFANHDMTPLAAYTQKVREELTDGSREG